MAHSAATQELSLRAYFRLTDDGNIRHWPMAKNVLGSELQTCSMKPLTGFFRDGCCHTSKDDIGMHTVCAIMTDDFLVYSKSMGNDLTTPRPEFDFPGLKAGDRWCVCLGRWLEALDAGLAPPVMLEATHASACEFIDREILELHAWSSDAGPSHS